MCIFRSTIDEEIERSSDLQVERQQLEEEYSTVHAQKLKVSESFDLITSKINHLRARTYEIPEKPVAQFDEEGVE